MVHDIIYELIQLNGDDTRRINHALKVYGFARCIAGREHYSENDMLVVSLSAMLHDIAIRHCEAVYGSCGGKLQEKEGPGIARPLLEKYTNDEALIAHVCDIIAHHHTYKGVDDICHQVIIEADFLVNFDEGEFERPAFETAVCKHFKTAAGKELAEAMFGVS
jgi:HD superfamily phosphodiesterase